MTQDQTGHKPKCGTIADEGARHPGDDFGDQLDAWAEEQARKAADGQPAALDDLAMAEWSRSGDAGRMEKAEAAASPLALTREVISALGRFAMAAKRVTAAFHVREEKLRQKLELERGWSIWAQQRCQRIEGKIATLERQRLAMQSCTLGKVAIRVYRCKCCGQVQMAGEQSCNQRTCPRCCAKLRRQNQAHVMDLLEVIDRRRRQMGQQVRPPRFLTLTMPSLPAFLPMRRLFCRAWSRFTRLRIWTANVGAAVAALETTHTRAGWHVHLHALIDCFLPRAKVVRDWQLAVLAEVLADALNRREAWTGAPLLLETLHAIERMRRALKRSPLYRGEGEAARIVHLADFIDEALRDVHQAQREPVAEQLRQLVAMIPTEVGVHLSMPKGTREEIVRELSKYLAKDLAGASTPEGDDNDDWGVAGTPERLAEFMDGIRRWRALRTYGLAQAAADELEKLQQVLECETCAGDLEFVGVEWCTEGEAQVYRRERRRRRKEPAT